jgi:hypothetical protein
VFPRITVRQHGSTRWNRCGPLSPEVSVSPNDDVVKHINAPELEVTGNITITSLMTPLKGSLDCSPGGQTGC